MLIFDCDGVVLDSMLLHTKVEAEAYQNIGIEITPEELALRFSGISQDEVSRILEKETGTHVPQDLEAQIEKKKDEVFTKELQPIPGIYETLKSLENFPRCIASGTGIAGLKHMLSVTNLYNCFAPNIFSSEMVSKGKPFPDLFLYAAQKMGIMPNNCFVIEDASAGVEAGIAAGMRVIGFAGGSHCNQDHAAHLIKSGAELVFTNMSDLPDIIYERVENE